MSSINSLIQCPEIQGQLNDYFNTCDASHMIEGVILQPFLYSEANSVSGRQRKLQETVSPGGGKSRRVELLYDPRVLESDVRDNEGREDCTATNLRGDVSSLYEVGDNYVQDSFLIDPMVLRYKCQDNMDWLMQKLQQSMDAVTRKRETKIFNALALMYGNFSVGEPDVAAKTKLVKTELANGNLNTDMMEEIGISTTYAGYCARPVVIGGRATGKYMRKISAGCCSLDGVDVGELSALYGMAFLESYRADDAFGANRFMTLAPGAVQLIEWLEYEGPDGINHLDAGNYKQLVVTDPKTGARYDMKFNMDCNGKISIFVRSYFKLVNLPGDMFFPGDRLAGVNFVNRFVIDNA